MIARQTALLRIETDAKFSKKIADEIPYLKLQLPLKANGFYHADPELEGRGTLLR